MSHFRHGVSLILNDMRSSLPLYLCILVVIFVIALILSTVIGAK